jgi:hypothetical protein
MCGLVPDFLAATDYPIPQMEGGFGSVAHLTPHHGARDLAGLWSHEQSDAGTGKRAT